MTPGNLITILNTQEGVLRSAGNSIIYHRVDLRCGVAFCGLKMPKQVWAYPVNGAQPCEECERVAREANRIMYNEIHAIAERVCQP